MKGLLRTSVAVCLTALFLLGGIVEAQDLTIGNHTLISKKRVSRVEYEYTYTADVTNSGSQGFEDVSASVMSNSSHTLVVDADLNFPDISAGDTATSTDTFSFLQDRQYAFSWDDLVWTVTGDPVTAEDSDGDGVGNSEDNCPNTSNTDQNDADGDGAGDVCDGCMDDPNKTEPGVCGCGVADTDSDGDGTADCNDICPGFDDNVDSDGDGIPDGCDTEEELPPDPAQVAPELDPTVATSVFAATEFLYTGADPIQTGMDPAEIDPKRAAIIRGKVLTRQGDPLTGVTIAILNRPEYGSTVSRADGMFDMAVNGGGYLTVNCLNDRYLPIQRQLIVPWQDYVWLPDVVMIPVDTQVTTIDLTSDDPMQVARSSEVTDSDGIRSATLLIPQNTSAELVMPDGSTQAISTLNIRATEYTVGDNGPEAMPAVLPPTSLYTYAFELSTDEALAVGATDVRFDQPLYFYVENFIGFPVGGIAPVGYYDKEKAAWIASDNGRVIKIIDIIVGMANLDTDGDGAADDTATLGALGITDSERRKLASLYPNTPQSVWRVPMTHFSFWDINWAGGAPDDATGANMKNFGKPSQVGNPCENHGSSIIECQNQVLGERIPVVGTAFTLNYRSSRVSGFENAYTLEIPLSGDNIPDTLKRIDLEVFVAGRHFKETFPATTNLSHAFIWDGKDVYDRVLQGAQPVRVRVGYVYDAVYYEPAEFEQSFARFGNNEIEGVEAREEVIIWQELMSNIGLLDANGRALGSWGLDVHHAYDTLVGILYLGHGQQRSAGDMPKIITTVAGNGLTHYNGDGIPATEAALFSAGVALGPDGSIYIADGENHRIRRVGPDGIITTVAGNGTQGYAGDGGPATEAQISGGDVALGPDGSIYIAETFNFRIRRVGPDGIITTVAGNGESYYNGDGIPATEAAFTPYDLALGPDGSIYIADLGNFRIRRVGPDGIITTVAGNGTQGYAGDDGPSTEAQLGYVSDIALDSDGSIYIADATNYRIRRIGPDGIITTVAGNGTNDYTGAGDGGPATEAQIFQPCGLALGLDGSIYISTGGYRIRRVGPDGIITTFAGTGDLTSGRGDGGPATEASVFAQDLALGPDGSLYTAGGLIRKIYSALPEVTVEDITITSKDGTEIYHFNANGRHLQTLDALTGAVIYEFEYDGNGLLSAVEDGYGNVTTIERNGDGNPTAIISPYGQSTNLSLDANGHLSGLTNPAGEHHTFEYTGGGLLAGYTDPRNNQSSYTYDDHGLLVKAEDPVGGFKEFERTTTDDGYEVSRITAMGRTDTYSVEYLSTGEKRRVHTMGCCSQNDELIGTNGSRTITYVDGKVITELEGPDPRWGMQAPLLQSFTITTPGGLNYVEEMNCAVTLTDPDDLLSLETLTNTRTINGHTYTSVFNAAQNQITTTTPEGRQLFTEINTQGRMLKKQLAGLYATHYNYDSQGRLDTITFGLGDNQSVDRVYAIDYNAQGYVWRITDPLNRAFEFAYDNAGRVLSQTSDGRQITLVPDSNGNIVSITPPGKPAHTLSYTPVNLLDVYGPPALSGIPNVTTDYDYNLDRKLKLITSPDGSTISPAYDSTTGRLESVGLPAGKEIQFFYYDGDPPGEPDTGRMQAIKVLPEDINITYSYDGSLLVEETWGGAVQGTVGRTHNNDFMTQSLSINSNFFSTAFTYDDDGLLTQAVSSGIPLAVDFSIALDTDNGLITGTTLDKITTTQTYNGFGEPATYSAAINGTPVFEVAYDRDKLGRITDLTETVDSVTTTYHYEYDVADRLTTVTKNGTPSTSYTYDNNGSRLSHTAGVEILSGTYDDQDRLLQYGNTTYTYTANGELLTKTENSQTTNYDYDVPGNLIAVTLPDNTAIEYIIDGRDRRISKKVNGTIVQGFLYQDGLNPVAELDAANNIISVFVYATRPNVPDYMVSKKEDGATWVAYRIISSHTGSVRMVINTTTNGVVQRLDYDEFGNVVSDTNHGFQPFGFAGGIYDPDTELTRFGARDYDAFTGRWTAKDPILFSGGDTNLYGYVFGDPINNMDITGKQATPPCSDGMTALEKPNECVKKRFEDRPQPKSTSDFSPWKEYKPLVDKANETKEDVNKYGKNMFDGLRDAANSMAGKGQ